MPSPINHFLTVTPLLLTAFLTNCLEAASSSRLSDEPVPMQTEGFPERPAPIIEWGQNPFLGNGYIAPGFTTPTGAVWQPLFIVYGTMRSALQSFDAGGPDGETSEWANRLDLFGNLYLTPTERILIGLRPLDENGEFSGYRFSDPEDDVDRINSRVHTLFMEGDFGELFPFLDPLDNKSLDYGFSIGRQPLSFQNGILINDNIDAIGITRSSLFLFGASAFRATALYGWNEIHRGNNREANDTKIYGLLTAADYDQTSFEIDTLYSESTHAEGGDQWNAGISMTRRIRHLNVSLSANTSASLEDGNNSEATGDGTLLVGQFSFTPPYTEDLAYANLFWGIDSFRSAARGPETGGPLGQVGILFAAVGIGSYGAPLGNQADESAGGAIGYQHFFNHTRGQLTFEIGGRTNTTGRSRESIAIGTRFQHAMGRHFVFRADLHASDGNERDSGYGARSEILLKF